MKTRLLALTFAIFLVLAAGAQAAEVRYAAPGASDAASCAQPTPCSLKTALMKAQSDAEIVVGTGSYVIQEPLTAGGEVVGRHDLYLHGQFGAPMPEIEYVPPKPSSSTPGIRIEGERSHASWLWVKAVGTGPSALSCDEGASVDMIRAESENLFGDALYGEECAISNILAIDTGTEGAGIIAANSTIRNVTAIGTGAQSPGIVALTGGFNPHSTVTVTNTIARGLTADLETYVEEETEEVELVVSHSNFDPENLWEDGGKIVQGAGNQSALPLFVNTAGGDYTQAAGSPTIGAGLIEPGIGSLDLAGNPRESGGVVDIGAYQHVVASPPPPPPPAVGEIQALKLTGTTTFAAAKSGEATVSSAKKKPKEPVGTRVEYTLSAAGTVTFTVERKTTGRKAGKKCVKQTKANKKKGMCTLLKPVKGSFAVSGPAGEDAFGFTGRVGGRALAPGAYLLVGATPHATRSVGFKIAG